MTHRISTIENIICEIPSYYRNKEVGHAEQNNMRASTQCFSLQYNGQWDEDQRPIPVI